MSIKIVLLKSGEDLITDIQEMVINDKVVGYFLNNPCVVNLKSVQQSNTSENSKTMADISLSPWMPLSQDKKIPITVDWVVTIVEPISNLKEMYTTTFYSEEKND